MTIAELVRDRPDALPERLRNDPAVAIQELQAATDAAWAAMHGGQSAVVLRLAEAARSPAFAACLAVCRTCSAFSESGWDCAAIRQACGCQQGSVRLRWAQGAACPLGKWDVSMRFGDST